MNLKIQSRKQSLWEMKDRGFTFVEIMFTLLIMGFVSLGMYQFLVDSTKIIFVSTEKNDVVNHIRQFTGEMENVARSANVAYIYKSFATTDRNAVSKRMSDGQSGNLVVFISIKPDANPLNPDLITKIVGYFLTPDGSGAGPLKKFELNYPNGVSVSTNTPESLMSGLSPTGNYVQVIDIVQGLSSGYLFYNFMNRSVMIKARFKEGNSAKQVTNTYNFTISPRG
jgi:prepilin-type N-terminal cleavage/methylation domain-containing protein